MHNSRFRYRERRLNKSIEDDTNESRRSAIVKAQTALKNKKWRTTIFNMVDGVITPCNVAPCNIAGGCGMTWHKIRPLNLPVAPPCNVTRSSGIMTLNSPVGSTLQYGRWLWDDMPWNSPKRPPYIGILHLVSILTIITAVDIAHQSAKFYGPPSCSSMSCRFSRRRMSHLGF